MATIHRCDGCGAEFETDQFLDEIQIGRNGNSVYSSDVCDDCRPTELVDDLGEGLQELLDRRSEVAG